MCGEQEPCCLTAHHLDPGDKEFSLSPAALIRTRISLQAIKAELTKAVVLCMNHHRMVHAGIIECPS